jgi:hypothetical protein
VPETEPRWLNRTEQAAWLSLAGMMIRLPGSLDAQLQRDSGLSLFEYFVISNLSMSPDRTSRMSERLEERGLVRREPSPENGRHINAILTDKGYEAVRQAAPGHVAAVRHYIFDALEPGQAEQLHDIGDRIVERTDPPAIFPRIDRHGRVVG